MPDLLDLPSELIEHILALLAHQDASSLPACRQTCRALNATIAESQLVRYIERAALLGVYDPLVSVSDVEAGAGAGAGAGVDADGTPTTRSMTIPERMAALEAWNEAWGALDDILCRGKPEMRFAMPSRDELRTGRMAEVGSGAGSAASARRTASTTTTATTTATASTRVAAVVANLDGRLIPVLPGLESELELDQQRWRTEDEEDEDEDEDEDDWHCHYSFGPWFVAAAREGPGVRAGYSYLDVHGSLGGGVGGAGAGRGVAEGGVEPEAGASCEGNKEEGGEGEESPRWTTINVPVRNIVVFALSTELDLAVAISCVVSPLRSNFHFIFIFISDVDCAGITIGRGSNARRAGIQ